MKSGSEHDEVNQEKNALTSCRVLMRDTAHSSPRRYTLALWRDE